MPIPDEEKFEPADLPDFTVSGSAVPPSSDDEEIRIPAPSEIATRIHLLGKLIIPPTPR